MPLSKNQNKIWNCKRCEFEMVEIEKDAIKEIIKTLNPNFLSLPKNYDSKKTEWIKICPRCDNYSLGLMTEYDFQIRTRPGELTTIHNLDFVAAHEHHHYRFEILNSQLCGCFYCLEIFPMQEIDDWNEEDPACPRGPGKTVLCPRCGIDSVLPDSLWFDLSADLLREMHQEYFS